MEIKDLLNIDEKSKEMLKLISMVLGIIALLLTAILFLYQFGVYVF